MRARPRARDGPFEYILQARGAALCALGADRIEVVVLELEGADALILAWRVGAGHRRSALEDGWLIAALLEQHGLT